MTRACSILLAILLVRALPAQSPADLYQAGQFAEALELLTERENVWSTLDEPAPDDWRELANTRLAIGMCELELANPDAAVSALENALAAQEKFDTSALERAFVLDTLGRAWQLAGNFEKAGNALARALALREEADPETGRRWVLVSRDHLGLLRLVEGRYEEAGQLLEGVIAETPADDTALLALRHHNYARYLLTIRSFHRATVHASQSVDLAKKAGETDLASYLDLLALVRLRAGDPVAAEATLFEALGELGKQPDSAVKSRAEAELLNKLGQLLLPSDPAQAGDFFQRSLDALRPWVPESHPSLAPYENNLGLALMKQGAHESAENCFARAIALLPATEKGHQRRAEYLQNRAWNSLLSGTDPATSDRVREACDSAEAVLAKLISTGTERERLNFLAHFDLYSLPAQAGETAILAGLLQRNKARLLEAILARGHAPAPSPPEPPCPALDYVRYTEQAVGEEPVPRYGVVVRVPGREPEFVALGTEQSLLRWLTVVNDRLDHRSALLSGVESNPPVLRLEAALRVLYREFLEPALKLVPDIPTLAISPDASLNFLPFACLITEENGFFASKFRQVLFMSSLRDFASNGSEDLREQPWEIFGLSEFPGWEGPELGDYFDQLAPLPHVGDELAILKTFAPKGSRMDLNPTNPEAYLKQLPSPPAVLHVASHAFFQEIGEVGSAVLDFDADPGLLRRSGIALTPGEGEDGILFPSEIAALPLDGTTLVTLSACQTGLGTPLGGEGVLGLRRAFALAGARNLLLTLWRVPDRSTAAFMSAFYREALRGGNLPASVWKLQNALLARDCPDVTDDEKLEEAVLRHGPFILCHRGPIPDFEVKAAATTPPPSGGHSWKIVLWIGVVVIGGVIAWLGRDRFSHS